MSRPRTHAPHRRRFRRALKLLWLLPVLLVIYWGVGRLTAPMRAVRIVTTPNAAAPSQLERPDVLTVVAYNIAHGRGPHGSNWDDEGRAERLREIAALLRELGADVVVLNEVDFDATWSRGVNQARVIAAAAGYPYRVEQRSFDLDLPLFRLKFGNAVLSRFPITSARPLDLPDHQPLEGVLAGSKEAAVCDVRLPSGRSVRVIPIHLEFRAERTRLAAVEPLLDAAAASPHPAILLGDFNSTFADLPGARPDARGHTAMELLVAHGLKTRRPKVPADVEGLTFPSDLPDRAIDWVMVDPGIEIVSYRVVSADLSDHRPVVAELRLPPRADEP